MNYKTLFTRFGSPSDEGRVNITGYLLHPAKLNETQRIKRMDETAERVIRECQAAILQLTDYRRALAARYAQLETAPYTPRLEIERRREGYTAPKVFYYVRILRVYQDGTTVAELKETYKGTERRNALARFEELKKQRPGIEAVKDIEKGAWER